jgi:hypothetical protein
MKSRQLAGIFLLAALVVGLFQNCTGEGMRTSSSLNGMESKGTGGTTADNPKVTSEIRFMAYQNAVIKNLQMCMSDVKFEAVDYGTSKMTLVNPIDLADQKLAVPPAGSTITTSEDLPQSVYGNVSLTLSNTCSGGSISFTNKYGSFSYTKPMTLDFYGVARVDANSNVISLDLSQFLGQLEQVKQTVQIAPALKQSDLGFVVEDIAILGGIASNLIGATGVAACPDVTVPIIAGAGATFNQRCENQQRELKNYMLSFNPGAGKNGLPVCGQTQADLALVEGSGNIDLTARTITSLRGRGFVSAMKIVSAEMASAVIRVSDAGLIKGRAQIVATRIETLNGNSTLADAGYIGRTVGLTCAVADIIGEARADGYYGAKGGRGLISVLNMRRDMGASSVHVKNMTIGKLLLCSDQDDQWIQGHLSLENSTYASVERVTCATRTP